MEQRHIIIGDVHGMSEELALLISNVQPTSKDIVIFVGDLVDKGPDSAGVVRMVREMAESASFDVVVVEGNHEEKHRRFRRNMSIRPAIAHDQAKNDGELVKITKLLSSKDVKFKCQATSVKSLGWIGFNEPDTFLPKLEVLYTLKIKHRLIHFGLMFMMAALGISSSATSPL